MICVATLWHVIHTSTVCISYNILPYHWQKHYMNCVTIVTLLADVHVYRNKLISMSENISIKLHLG